MRAPSINLGFTGILALAGLAVAGVAAVLAWRKGTSLAGELGQVLEQGTARVLDPIRQITAPRASGGDPVRAALYGREGYTGEDASGRMPADDEFYADPEGRRYASDYVDGVAKQGGPAPVTTGAGAVFGVFRLNPRRGTGGAGREPFVARPAQGYGAEVGARPSDDDNMQEQARMLNRWKAGSPWEAGGGREPVSRDPYTGTW